MKKVSLRVLAEQDLRNIWLYSFQTWGEAQSDLNGTKLRVFRTSLQSARSPPTWSFKRGVTGSKMPFVLSLSKGVLT